MVSPTARAPATSPLPSFIDTERLMPTEPHAAPLAESITVRMYRGLLGDCFLLTHSLVVGPEPDTKPRTYRALIDCGVLQRIGAIEGREETQKAIDHMADVVADLAETTGRHLDLVVATHEHYDHLSGFIRHHETFKTFSIDALWVAWTENPTDPEAKEIREKGKKATSILKAIVDRKPLTMDGRPDPRVEAINALLQFCDPEIEPWAPQETFAATSKPKPLYDPAQQEPRSCANVIDWLRYKAGEANVRYLEPGQLVRFGLNERLKASVLGPPRTDRLLKLNPTAGDQREVYLTKSDEIASLEGTLRVRSLSAAPNTSLLSSRPADRPFPSRFRRDEAARHDCPVVALYEHADATSRRIDGEWLGAAELLALKIDGDVNNTSLALAIELPEPRRDILLFPADAQVGNWLSWHDQNYPAKPATSDEPVETAADILRRVVLYKVGHHGSHNATAREKGLELMTSPHLAAMIPVTKAVAGEQGKDGWAMPYAKLFNRLTEKTRGRIILGDGDPTHERKAFGGSLFSLGYDETADDPLWVEARLDLSSSTSPQPRAGPS